MADVVKNLQLQFSNMFDFVLRDHLFTHSGIFFLNSSWAKMDHDLQTNQFPDLYYLSLSFFKLKKYILGQT